MNPNDSHLSTGEKQRPSDGPVRQHKRLAMGERANGTSNPEGKPAPTDNRIGNNQGKTY